MKKYFISGIGTDIGKTVIAAILCEAWKADYWKPIQAGEVNNTDAMIVKNLLSNNKSVIHPEAYLLSQPMSPHAAAETDGIEIDLKKIKLPSTDNTLVIEGAGGLLVPLNRKHLVIDLIEKLGAETILVSRNYLGSINHTLLSVEALKKRRRKIAGIIFNGNQNPETEKIILHYSGLKYLGRVGEEREFNKTTVKQYCDFFKTYVL